MNAGMDQIHVNYNDTPQDIKPTYTVKALKELEEIF
jgi:FMN phosphatase YigB (HAD superfamily)